MTLTRLYRPCPCCHDIGGLGRVQNWTLPGGRAFLVCEECNASWLSVHDLTWQRGEPVHGRVQQLGLDATVVDVQSVRTELELFSVPQAELAALIDQVEADGTPVRQGGGRFNYRQLQLSREVGRHGETVLVVGIWEGGRVAFPSAALLPEDFHW